ncbi:MAG: tetratricopeptide repeat-containing sensor histidine kinase [Bacteroidia bacterium]
MKLAIILHFSVLLLWLFGSKALAKTDNIDSLFAKANSIESPRERVVANLKLVNSISATSIPKAVEAADSLVALYESANDSFAIARAKSLKAWFLFCQVDYENSLTNAYEALAIQSSLKTDSIGLAWTQMRVGLVHINLENYNKAIQQLETALDLFIQLNDTSGIDMLYNNLGVTYAAQNLYKKSIEYYKKSLALRKKIKNYKFWVAYSYYNISGSFMDLKALDSADFYMDKAIYIFENETKSKKVPALAYYGIAELKFKKNELDKAKDFANKSLKISNVTQQTDIRLMAYELISKILEKQGNYKEAIETIRTFDKIKAQVDSTTNVKDIAEIEALYNQAVNEKKILELEKNKFEDELKISKNKWLIAIIIFCAFVLIIVIAFIFNKRAQAHKLKATELETEIAQAKLMALRAQMNPHFIFNCINTAQNFIVNSNKLEAYEYLADFARLLRLILENSGKQVVSLNEEIEHVKLYVLLEQIRFEQKFEVTYNIDDALLDGNFEVPSMLIQPFIENAIIHGIMNKKSTEKGQLKIQAELKNGYAQITIDDNGVGRIKALEIKRQKSVHFKSTAISNINERMAIFSKNLGVELNFEIIDKHDKGQSGTQVLVQLPLM